MGFSVRFCVGFCVGTDSKKNKRRVVIGERKYKTTPELRSIKCQTGQNCHQVHYEKYYTGSPKSGKDYRLFVKKLNILRRK